jgi:hypothetical protein
MPHTYHLSLTHVSDHQNNPVGERVCDFDFKNHDDLTHIIKRARQNNIVQTNEIDEFCLGLKLLTEVAMKHRNEPAFAEFWPHLGTFIRSIKEPRSREQA